MLSTAILFQINHFRPGTDMRNNSRVHVAIRKGDLEKLQSVFRGIELYRWVRHAFEQISAEQRTGDLMFYNPGLNVISICWNVQSVCRGLQFLPSLRKGIERVNKMKFQNGKYPTVFRLFMHHVQSSHWPITIAVELPGPERVPALNRARKRAYSSNAKE